MREEESSTSALFCDGWVTLWIKSMYMMEMTSVPVQFFPFGSQPGMGGSRVLTSHAPSWLSARLLPKLNMV